MEAAVLRIDVLGVEFDNLTLAEAVDRAQALAGGEGFHYVVTPNPEIVMTAQKDPAFQKVLSGADLVLPDGIGVIKAAAILGRPLKERVPGIDVAVALMGRMAGSGTRLFLLGAKPGVAEVAAEKLRAAYPGLQIWAPTTGIFRTMPRWWRPSVPPGPRWSLSAWGPPSRSSGWPGTARRPARS